MNKILTHLKNNLAIYLVIVIFLAVFLLLKLVPKHKENILDTSMFEVVDIKEALDLFTKSNEKAQVLIIGRKDCSACINFEPVLKIAQAKYHYYTHYLELSDLDKTSSEYQELMQKLDYEYTYNSKKAPFSEFIGLTPMFIILKNNKMVYGYIGTMSENVIKTMVETYGATYE